MNIYFFKRSTANEHGLKAQNHPIQNLHRDEEVSAGERKMNFLNQLKEPLQLKDLSVSYMGRRAKMGSQDPLGSEKGMEVVVHSLRAVFDV